MNSRRGFSLLEMVVTLILIGMMAIGLSTLFSSGVSAFIINKESIEAAQRSQFALKRITRELLDMTTITTALPNSISYQSPYGSFTIAVGTGVYNKQIVMIDSGGGTWPLIKDTSDSSAFTGNNVLFKYYQMDTSGNESPLTISTATDFNSLSKVEVTLLLNTASPNASAREWVFKTRVSPRNSGILNAPKKT